MAASEIRVFLIRAAKSLALSICAEDSIIFLVEFLLRPSRPRGLYDGSFNFA